MIGAVEIMSVVWLRLCAKVRPGASLISFADGHVAGFSHEQLYDPESLTSTNNALWSTTDRYFCKAVEPHEIPSP